MAPFEALYGRRCRTPLCWYELGENKVLGQQMLRDTKEKVQIIHGRLKQAFDRQKAYAYLKRRDIQYEVGDKVFLKVSPWKKRYRLDSSYILEPEEVELNSDLFYEEEPVQILDWEFKRLRNKSVPLVKVLSRNRGVEEATWEPEATMREQYPHLFDSDQGKLELEEDRSSELIKRRNKGIVSHNP
ncbi:hypothetical protein V6N12_042167 [Hibiscus sabdariffa]|uniref:Reverse transcriptase n=1 Tax=Hibiscus sabdariffa TaxID=183260 RepID=A0ABR2EE03_9ROSI